MKKFLIVSGSLLGLALLATIAVYCYISVQLQSSQQTVPSAHNTTSSGVSSDTVAPVEGIPLRSLPLSDAQADVLGKVGVDVDTFVITPAMQACAEEKLGTARMNEIIAGAAPSTLETAKLLPCLGG